MLRPLNSRDPNDLSKKKGLNLFKKVENKEIKNILERLETELKVGDLPFRRREEVKSLIYYLKTWLEWRDYREKETKNPYVGLSTREDGAYR